MAEWDRQLWAALDRPQGSYDPGSYVELVLGLLYLRLRQPRLWRWLLREPNGGAVREVLVRAELPGDPDMPRIPLFETILHIPKDERSLIEVIRTLGNIDLSVPDDATSTVVQFVDHLLTQFERATSEHCTPRSIVQCMVELTDPQQHDHIYDPFCRSGELLATTSDWVEGQGGNVEDLTVCGQAANNRFWRLTKLNAALHGFDVDLGPGAAATLHGDVHPDRGFDVVLANPPFNMSNWSGRDGSDGQRWSFGLPPRHNANFAWLQHIESKLVIGGRAAVLMPNVTTTTRSRAEESIRTRMVDAGVVDCVVELPGQLFRSTGIPVSLWVLRSAREKNSSDVLLLDATRLGTMIDRVQRVLTAEDLERIIDKYHAWRDGCPDVTSEEATEFARVVSRQEIRQRGYVLSPRAYLQGARAASRPERSLETINEIHAELTDLRTRSRDLRATLDAELAGVLAGILPGDVTREWWIQVLLEEVADILAGPGTVDRGEYQSSWVPIVLPRNIKHNRIIGDELDAVGPQATARLDRYRLVPGDVICTRTGSLGRYGLVRPEQAGWLLGPGCMRLRPTAMVDPGYLTYYLNSSVACSWLESNATGSAIRHINTRTLGRMPIILPPISVQREIGTILGALDSEIVTQSQICATTQALRDLLLPLLITDLP